MRVTRYCEARSDVAIQLYAEKSLDCRASLAMTRLRFINTITLIILKKKGAEAPF